MRRTIQDLTFETRDLDDLATMLRAAVAVLGGGKLFVPPEGEALEEGYPSHAAAWMMDFLGHPPYVARGRWPREPGPKHYQRVCHIAEAGEPLEREVAAADLVVGAVELLRRADTARFEALTGEGPFRRADGTTIVGYRMHQAPMTGGLFIGLCHFYLSK